MWIHTYTLESCPQGDCILVGEIDKSTNSYRKLQGSQEREIKNFLPYCLPHGTRWKHGCFCTCETCKINAASLVAQMVKNLPAMWKTWVWSLGQEGLLEWRICLQCWRPGLDLWSGKIPAEGSSYPLQYSCLKNPLDRVAWQATVHGGHKKSDMPEQLTHNEH